MSSTLLGLRQKKIQYFCTPATKEQPWTLQEAQVWLQDSWVAKRPVVTAITLKWEAQAREHASTTAGKGPELPEIETGTSITLLAAPLWLHPQSRWSRSQISLSLWLHHLKEQTVLLPKGAQNMKYTSLVAQNRGNLTLLSVHRQYEKTVSHFFPKSSCTDTQLLPTTTLWSKNYGQTHKLKKNKKKPNTTQKKSPKTQQKKPNKNPQTKKTQNENKLTKTKTNRTN